MQMDAKSGQLKIESISESANGTTISAIRVHKIIHLELQLKENLKSFTKKYSSGCTWAALVHTIVNAWESTEWYSTLKCHWRCIRRWQKGCIWRCTWWCTWGCICLCNWVRHWGLTWRCNGTPNGVLLDLYKDAQEGTFEVETKGALDVTIQVHDSIKSLIWEDTLCCTWTCT